LIEDLYREHGFVRVYGESVACLWSAGQTSAALDLKDLWNEYAAAGVFSLFCAYPMRWWIRAPRPPRPSIC
jgi:hypothetical protein